ncbi:MAG TPA: SDR family oxidoreductase [Gaiellaceae bacterium]|nr:SDR family oxidoreductase [Gaiellaceae bacterium]
MPSAAAVHNAGVELEGKVAIVTGAGTGIGRAIAARLAADGAHIAINYRGSQDEAEALDEQLPHSIAVQADISEPDEVQAMVEQVERELGPPAILVNNAGLEQEQPLLELELDNWHLTLGVNLTGAFLCLQACARVMARSGGGSIVNISSIHEDLAFPGYSAYCAAKGGLRMLMRNAAVELAEHGIRVNNVAPGAIKTPINAETLDDPEKVERLKQLVPLQRVGTPEEVAEVVAFLASDRSRYVTGSTYFVDGGMIRHAEPL